MKKLSSTEPVPGAKKVGDHFSKAFPKAVFDQVGSLVINSKSVPWIGEVVSQIPHNSSQTFIPLPPPKQPNSEETHTHTPRTRAHAYFPSPPTRLPCSQDLSFKTGSPPLSVVFSALFFQLSIAFWGDTWCSSCSRKQNGKCPLAEQPRYSGFIMSETRVSWS